MEAPEVEPHSFIPTMHQVDTLDRRTRRAFAKVIDGTQRDHPSTLLIQSPADIRIVRSGQDFWLGMAIGAAPLVHNTHKRLLSIRCPEGLPEAPVVDRLSEKD